MEKRWATWATVAAIYAIAAGVITAVWLLHDQHQWVRHSQQYVLGLQLVKDFDSEDMRRSRRALAKQLIEKRPISSDAIADTRVIDFFETMGDMLVNRQLDRTMIEQNFSYWVTSYWRATQNLIETARTMAKDGSIYSNFEGLNAQVGSRQVQNTSGRKDVQLSEFLKDEASLPK